MDPQSPSVRLRAPAKINLGLEVLGRREDGYHELVTLYQTIGLWDDVTLRFGGSPGVRLRVEPAGLDLGAPDENLAVRAADLFPEAVRAGLSITLRKRIPAGAGLGGGSSDAAAVLAALGSRTGKDREALHAMAATLGSDVPFFLDGGTQLGLGRGEKLLPLPPLPPMWVLLIYPGFPSETRQVYAGLNLTLTRRGALISFAERFAACRSDSGGTIEQALFGERAFDPGACEGAGAGEGERGAPIERRDATEHPRIQKASLAESSLLGPSLAGLHNDLERIATALNPALSELLRELKQLGANARVTGSGSCLFALAPNRSLGRLWCAHFRDRFDLQAVDQDGVKLQGRGWARLLRTEARGVLAL